MIDVACIGHSTEFELNNLIHLFSPFIQKDYRIESIYEEGLLHTRVIEVEANLLWKETFLPVSLHTEALLSKKWIKLVAKKAVYELLEELTGKKMPWGTLTGIRPTKIVHEYLEEGYSDLQIKEMLMEYYHISTEKIDLMLQVAHKELAILDGNKPGEINLYVGIPFCPTRCVYCSFTAYSLEKKKDSVDAYLDALCKEISFVAKEKAGIPIRSLYIGGGTPTSLNEKQLERLLVHIQDTFPLESIEEYTVEAGRPDTINREKLRIMKAYGVNRISINPQSMNEKTLEEIGRKHTVQEIIDVFKAAREVGHDNINMDIILGLPGEGVEEVSYTLEELKKLKPDNITVHTLAIKRASRLKEEQQQCSLAEGNKIEEMLLLCEEATKQMGLAPYYMYRQKDMLGNFENVGYALPKKECIYNVEIMEEKESIIAMGAGAVTKMVYQNGERIDRVPNVKSLEDYITRIDEMLMRKKEGFLKYQ